MSIFQKLAPGLVFSWTIDRHRYQILIVYLHAFLDIISKISDFRLKELVKQVWNTVTKRKTTNIQKSNKSLLALPFQFQFRYLSLNIFRLFPRIFYSLFGFWMHWFFTFIIILFSAVCLSFFPPQFPPFTLFPCYSFV